MRSDLHAAREWLDSCRTLDALHDAWTAIPDDLRAALDRAGDGHDARFALLQRSSIHNALTVLGAEQA